MLRLTRGEESKLTAWYFELDRGLLTMILLLVVVGAITMITAGSAEAAKMGQPWFFFIKKAIPAYILGLTCLFGCSMLSKQSVIRVSILCLIVGIFGLLVTLAHPVVVKGSARWAHIGGFGFMPADVLKPALIVLTAWFLNKMRGAYGSDIFLNKEAWRAKWLSWWPYIAIFLLCVAVFFKHPDIGNLFLYLGVLFVMLFVAGFPLKFLPFVLAGVGALSAIVILTKEHVRSRFLHMFDVDRWTQAWYSINSIKHGGLFGSGSDAYVKDVLPESTNDFVYAAIAEDWGAVGCIALVLLLLLVLNRLLKHAIHAREDFVVFALAGTAALFGGQICFNLMTALHLFVSKGMTLPFISYGGVSFISFCIIFGMILALVREDTWNK
ncbi:MAG: FtsW/RodA/SpoVE family cell cycle protein [Alphaproteobacteria bacterium]